MERRWFVRKGWVHVPCSLAGMMIALAAALFCLQVFIAVDRRSHSVSDTFYGVFPYFACTFLLLNWVAGNTTGKSKMSMEGTHHASF
jgi:hypothetical protein